MNWLKVDDIAGFMQAFLLFALIFQAAATDLQRRRIYNLPVLIALIGGLLLAFVRGGLGGLGNFDASGINGGGDEMLLPLTLLEALLGAAAMFCPFFIAYLTGGMGAGDAKLAAAIGALTGWKFALWALLHTAIAGAALAVICLLLNRDLLHGLRRSLRMMMLLRRKAAPSESDNAQEEKPVTVPYAAALCVGVVWTVWLFYSRGYQLPFM